MIENFASICGKAQSEFFDLNHTGHSMVLVPLMTAKLAHEASLEFRRASESGH
jgi:hypothetical protein